MKKIVVILIIVAIVAVIFYFFYTRDREYHDPRGTAYAGSITCLTCHGDLYKSYLHTAHYIASSIASSKTVHGSFAVGANVFELNDSDMVVMEKRDGGLFQTYYKNGKIIESHRFDIVMGGVKGESYLYWNDNGLNQLPVSWFSKQDKWLLSPRYDPRHIDFSRTMRSRCFECHASYIGDLPNDARRLNDAEQFDKSSIVYSIDCERCHGPGTQHVDYQTNHPEIKTSKFITQFSSLPQARRMDVCGVCHSGNKSQMLRSTFWFKPGDTLARFKLPDFETAIDTTHLDVHGNQVQLLQSSKCYINSNMDCATCHNTHQDQRGNTALFTQKCMGCHSADKHNYCKMPDTINAEFIKSNCIQCHMPALPSMAIISPNGDKTLSADIFVHTHHIAIYPQEVKKILAYLGK
ncbi:MAG: cytochrome c3 family protein [Ginsengibacter sp.]